MYKLRVLFQADVLARGYINKDSRTGVYFVTKNLLANFTYDNRFEVTLFFKYPVSREILDAIKHDNSSYRLSTITQWRVINNGYRFFDIPNPQLKYNNYDCFFSCYGGDIQSMPIPCFGILHDTIPILYPSNCGYPDNIDENPFYKLHSKNLNRDNFYFCVSKSCQDDFLRLFPGQLKLENMHIVPMATMRSLSPQRSPDKLASVFKRYGAPTIEEKKYILTLCTVEPRKNIPFTIKCFAKFIYEYNIKDLYFVFGGATFGAQKVTEQLDQEIAAVSAMCRNKIVRLGYVADEDMEILYSHALLFTFISQYEGFGMPPLEAMSCGTPVITSDKSALPEVVGTAAIMVPPNDEGACIKAFSELYFNSNLREELVKKGFERVNLFSWEKTYKTISEKVIYICSNIAKKTDLKLESATKTIAKDI